MSAAMAADRSRRGKKQRRDTEPAGRTACPACGERVQSGARFCQNCGRALTAGGWLDAQRLSVLGAGAVALVVLGLLFASIIETGPTVDERPAATVPSRKAATTPSGQPPDLSTMSPREAADRLFNRVMTADEQGDEDQVTQFAPMAVAAYDRLEDLDLDALYHLGLIHAAVGDADGAWDAVERLRAAVPGHLLASLLEHRLALDVDDQAKAKHAIERFEANYQEEIKIDRREYSDHRRSIDQFRTQIGTAARDDG